MIVRVLLCTVLAVAMVACSRDQQAPGGPHDGVDASQTAVESVASSDDESGQPEADPNQPGAAPVPVELNLSLPGKRLEVDEGLFEATPETQLPDLFEASERERRTRFSGELILGDGDEEGLKLDRIQGGAIEVEVSID